MVQCSQSNSIMGIEIALFLKIMIPHLLLNSVYISPCYYGALSDREEYWVKKEKKAIDLHSQRKK